MLKKIIAIALMTSFAILPAQVSAASRNVIVNGVAYSNSVQPRYNVLVSAYPNLYFSDGNAICELYMACGKESDKIAAKVTLYKISSSGAKERIRYYPSISSSKGVVRWNSPDIPATSGNYLMVVSATITGSNGSDSYYEEVEVSY